jgi:NADH pyrophosphatase NudC (nudix superfamily)
MSSFQFCPKCAKPLVDRSEEGRTRRACESAECGFVHYDNPTPVVAAIVEHEGDVILVRNKGWPEKWFGLVTGFLERGETPETGVLRELKEELGLDGQIVSFVGHYSFDQMNQLIIAYHVKASGAILVGEELAGFKRVSPEKLRPWPFGTGQAVADWLARRQA